MGSDGLPVTIRQLEGLVAHDVFISYSMKDKVTADAMCASLESADIRCWIAPRDITAGRPWSECILEGIEQSRVMVLLFTADANASPHVLREVERAVNCRVDILTFRVENVPPAKALEYFIATPHWLDALTPPLEAHLKELAAAINVLLARMQPDKRRAKQEAVAKAERKRRKAAERDAIARAEHERQEEAAREAAATAERERQEQIEREAAARAERDRREQLEREADAELERHRRQWMEAQAAAKAEEERRADLEPKVVSTPVRSQPGTWRPQMPDQEAMVAREKVVLGVLASVTAKGQLCVYPDIPPSKLATAIARCDVPKSEKILALIPTDLLRSGRCAILFGRDAIYSRFGPFSGPIKTKYQHSSIGRVISGATPGQVMINHELLCVGNSGISYDAIYEIIMQILDALQKNGLIEAEPAKVSKP